MKYEKSMNAKHTANFIGVPHSTLWRHNKSKKISDELNSNDVQIGWTKTQTNKRQQELLYKAYFFNLSETEIHSIWNIQILPDTRSFENIGNDNQRFVQSLTELCHRNVGDGM